MKKLIVFISSVLLFTACYTTYTTVGNFDQLEKQGQKTYKYDQTKQFYLFGGLIPLGHAQAKTPNEACQIKEKFKFVDLLISSVTADILSCRTIQVYAIEGASQFDPKVEQKIEEVQKTEEPQKEEVAKKAEKKKKQDSVAAEQNEVAQTAVTESNVKEEKTEKSRKKETASAANEDTLKSETVATTEVISEPVATTEPVAETKQEPAQSEPVLNPVVDEVEEPFAVAPKEEPVQQVEPAPVNIIEQGAIRAEFSVGATKKVYFSKGNLQYQASSRTWRFSEQQYEMVGAGNSNISLSNSGWIDLFGWGTSGWDNRNTYYMPYDTESGSAVYGYGYGPTDGQSYEYSLRGKYAEADWGVANVISEAGDSAGMWRTLTRAEWGYLLLKRPNSTNLYSLATVNGVKGMVLLPDNWSYPQGCNFIARTSFELNVYNLEQWKKMESFGAVFLPSAGCRYGTTVGNVGTTGGYWTATAAGGENAWYFVFNKTKIDINSDFSRGLGRSVRLVQDVK